MIIIALGSNLPGTFASSEDVIQAAYGAIENTGIRILQKSPVYRTAPVPASDQPDYYNAVITAQADYGPEDLLRILKKIEHAFGPRDDVRNSPRVLDLDLIDYNGKIIQTHDPVLPHPRMHERTFVLRPLCDLNPDWLHPVLKRTTVELLEALEKLSTRT